MPLERQDATRLMDMLHHAEVAQKIVGARAYEIFEADETARLAVVRCIEIIGEAGHQVSATVQASLPTVPWHQMRGMRNRLIHDYGNTDYRVAYRVVREELPRLISTVTKYLAANGPQP